MKLQLVFVSIVLCCTHTHAQEELLKNADFEEEFGNDNWFCFSCSITHSTDAHMGQFSGYVTNRPDSWRVPSYWITDVVQPGNSYFFSAWIKLVGQTNSLFDSVGCQVRVEYADGGMETLGFSANPLVREDQGWQQVGGDFTIPQGKEISGVRLYVQAPATGEFLIDTSSLTEIPALDENWREVAARRIEQIRMSDFTLKVSISDDIEPSDVAIEVNMTRHEFSFGSAVKWWLIHGVTERDRRYQDFFYTNFNWGTEEVGLKWKNMEQNKGQVNYNVDNGINKLLAKNIKLRGHTLFWGKPGNDPDWLNELSREELKEEIDTRIDRDIVHFAGRLEHWDINNEMQHGTFYEENTGEHEITDYMFHRVKALQPDVQLFLNDYGCINYGQSAMAMKVHAQNMINRGTPLDAIGLQSHLFGTPNLANIQKRLDAIAESNLPIWITEVSYVQPDVSLRADVYTDIYRLFFSHASVEGVLLWGFWDQENNKPDSSLADGDFLELNEAGERLLNLLHKEWHTEAAFYPVSAEDEVKLRGFHGEYTATVKVADEIVQELNFVVARESDNVVEIEIS